jgi:hypothetical protein
LSSLQPVFRMTHFVAANGPMQDLLLPRLIHSKSKSRGDDVDVRVGGGLIMRSERLNARPTRVMPGYEPTQEPGRRKLPRTHFLRSPPKELALTATYTASGSSYAK